MAGRNPDYESYASKIYHLYDLAKNQINANLADTHIQSVGCTDGKTANGNWNPPGGIVFLDEEGILYDFMQRRKDSPRNGRLLGHTRCGYMLVIHGLENERDQDRLFNKVRRAAIKFNEALGTNFQIPKAEHRGTAEPFMALKRRLW